MIKSLVMNNVFFYYTVTATNIGPRAIWFLQNIALKGFKIPLKKLGFSRVHSAKGSTQIVATQSES